MARRTGKPSTGIRARRLTRPAPASAKGGSPPSQRLPTPMTPATAHHIREDGGCALEHDVAPAQHVEERMDVRLRREVEPRAYVALRRAHALGTRVRVIECVDALALGTVRRRREVGGGSEISGCVRSRDADLVGSRDADAELRLAAARGSAKRGGNRELPGRSSVGRHPPGATVGTGSVTRLLHAAPTWCELVVMHARKSPLILSSIEPPMFIPIDTLAWGSMPYSCGTTKEAKVRAAS